MPTQISGLTGVNQVQDGSINTSAKISAGVILANAPVGSGLVLQSVNGSSNSTYQNVSANKIPFTDSVPLVTAGDQILTVTVTPIRVGSTIRCTAKFIVGTGTSAGISCAAMFAGSACTDADGGSVNDNVAIRPYFLTGSVVTVSLSPIVFQVRLAPDTATANVYLNGNGIARRFGGASVATINCVETA